MNVSHVVSTSHNCNLVNTLASNRHFTCIQFACNTVGKPYAKRYKMRTALGRPQNRAETQCRSALNHLANPRQKSQQSKIYPQKSSKWRKILKKVDSIPRLAQILDINPRHILGSLEFNTPSVDKYCLNTPMIFVNIFRFFSFAWTITVAVLFPFLREKLTKSPL